MVKRSKMISQQIKAMENPNIPDIKSVTVEHTNVSRKLSKTIKQTEKVSQAGSGKSYNSPLYGINEQILKKSIVRQISIRIQLSIAYK